jgi:hypothetical protein
MFLKRNLFLFLFIFIDKIVAWKRNHNKNTFSRGNLCCWVRDFSENLVDDAIARCSFSPQE